MTDSDRPAGPPGASSRPAADSPRTAHRAKQSRRRRRRQRPTWVKVLLRTAIGFVVLFALGALALWIAYLRTEIPEPNKLAQQQTSVIYYDDGKTELARFNNTTREPVPLAKVPQEVRYAFLSAEDRSFYENEGVSVPGMVRALWTNLRGGNSTSQGGSTITQQYVKNYFLSRDKTYTRKFKEVMISLKISKELPKDKILENYLNTIYFGRNAYGIQAASKAYFNKNSSQLTASEGAFLASVVNSPSRLDPTNGQVAKNRVNARMVYVLDGMVTEGWLTAQQRQAAKFPVVVARKQRQLPGSAGYIRDVVTRELLGPLGLTQEDIDRGGLRITTTVNKKAQDSAVRAVNDNLPDNAAFKNLHVGLVAQKPGDGAVVAMYGGRSIVTERNNATGQLLQGASSFKVFGLTAGLQDGMTLNTRFTGNSPMYFKQYKSADNPSGKVYNFENQSFGRVSLRKALASSVNTVFLQVNDEVGPRKTAAAAELAGIPASSLDDKQRGALSNVLGTPSVRVMDMATSFNTYAGEGQRADPYFIKKVTSVSESYSYTAKPKPKRVIDRDIAMNVRSAMEGVVDDGGSAEKGTRGLNRHAAGKTGTSNNNMSVWFSGFTPQLTASVGMFDSADGGKTTRPMKNLGGLPLTGGQFPTEVWTAFMKGALQGLPDEKFPEAPKLTGERRQAPTTVAPRTSAPERTTESSAPETTEPSSTSAPTSTEPSSTSSSAPSSTAPSSTTSAPRTTTSAPRPTTSAPRPTTSAPRPTTTRPKPTATRPPTSAPRPTSSPGVAPAAPPQPSPAAAGVSSTSG